MSTVTTPKTTYLKDYQPFPFDLKDCELDIELYPEETIVNTKLHFVSKNQNLVKAPASLILFGEGLSLQHIQVNGLMLQEKEYELEPNKLIIQVVPEEFILEIKHTINPAANTELSGLYFNKGLFCTQCEAEGFRRITYFPDRPDVLTHFTTTLHADKLQYPVLLSNGNLVAKGDEGTRHWVQWVDPFKKPSYLFAMVAGDLIAVEDHYLTQSKRLVSLKLYVERENLEKTAFALQALKKAFLWDEQKYGREYDLDIYMIVAVNDFNMGAMENKGLNIFNAKYILASKETATDIDYQNIDAVVGHEYFHNWSGNRVTCRDWFQLSLKEGLTVFREQQFSQDIAESEVLLIDNVRLLKSRQFAEDASPLAHSVRPDSYIEINNFYTVTIYEKGAELIRMLHTLLGPEKFRKAMDLYFERHDGQAATTDDFIAAMEAVSNRSLTQFTLWYTQAGTPQVTVTEHYDINTQEYTLTFTQTCPDTPQQTNKKPMHIPILMGLLTNKGEVQKLQLKGGNSDRENVMYSENTILLELSEQTHSYTFEKVQEEPIPSILRKFSAPIKLNIPLDNKRLSLLLAHDTDAFNRFDAVSRLMEAWILQLYTDKLHKVQGDAANTLLIEALRIVINNASHDYAMSAELLTFPSLEYLLDLIDEVEVDILYAAYELAIKTCAIHLHIELQNSYHALQVDKHYEYNSKAIGQRRFKNLCLYYLQYADKLKGTELSYQQFITQKNMTDKFSALSVLASIDCGERVQALHSFYEQFQLDALVVCKWLGVQASSRATDTFAVVKELINHPAFDRRNPNKVYALLGGFGANVPHFHRNDGAGYMFLKEQVLLQDKINPQVAARIFQPFVKWRRVNIQRQVLLKKVLEEMKSLPSLSNDLYELISKTLQ